MNLITKSKVCIYIVLSILFSVSFLLIFRMEYLSPTLYRNDNRPNEIMKEIVYSIDSVDVDDNFIQINGWIVRKNENNDYINNHYFLKSKTGDIFILPSQSQTREDVTSYFDDDFNYNKTGLVGKLKLNKLQKEEYELGILMIDKSGEEKLIITEEKIEL